MLGQLLLPMAKKDRDALAGARFRSACKAVAKSLGYKAVAELWGCDETIVGLKIDELNRNYMKPTEVLLLKSADTNGIIAAAEGDREAPPSSDEVVRNLPGVLRELFAEELAELVERKLRLR